MSTERGSPVQTATSEPVSTPAAAPAAASSFTDKVLQAKTPAAIRALKEEALRPAPAQPPAAQPAATPDPLPTDDTPPAAAPDATEQPAGEETPAAESAPGEETPTAAAAQSDEDGEEDGGEGPVTPHSGKRAHLRLADGDEVGRLAASYKKRNRDWTLEQCLNAAKDQLGVKPDATADAAPKPSSDLPTTIAEMDVAEETLLAQKAQHLTSLNFEEAHKVDVALRKLDRHRSQLEKDAEKQEGQRVTSYEKDFNASHARAAEIYPFVSDQNSPGGKRMLEIEASLEELKDPLFASPDKPFKIAQMVAAELNIAPKKRGATAPAKPAVPVTPTTPALKKGILPTGTSRTTVPVATKPAIDAEIGGIKTIAQIRAFRQRHGLPV